MLFCWRDEVKTGDMFVCNVRVDKYAYSALSSEISGLFNNDPT